MRHIAPCPECDGHGVVTDEHSRIPSSCSVTRCLDCEGRGFSAVHVAPHRRRKRGYRHATPARRRRSKRRQHARFVATFIAIAGPPMLERVFHESLFSRELFRDAPVRTASYVYHADIAIRRDTHECATGGHVVVLNEEWTKRED